MRVVVVLLLSASFALSQEAPRSRLAVTLANKQDVYEIAARAPREVAEAVASQFDDIDRLTRDVPVLRSLIYTQLEEIAAAKRDRLAIRVTDYLVAPRFDKTGPQWTPVARYVPITRLVAVAQDAQGRIYYQRQTEVVFDGNVLQRVDPSPVQEAHDLESYKHKLNVYRQNANDLDRLIDNLNRFVDVAIRSNQPTATMYWICDTAWRRR